jgi:adenosylcobinamide kinase/adenosylcobinamide-phosphate guanylyltransferase
MGRIVLIGGGARSGKSRFASAYATQIGSRRLFVATLRAESAFDVVVIDCLTLWLSNLLLEGLSDTDIEQRVANLTDALDATEAHVIAVTNEVGLGIVPEHALARRFRDIAGRVHQRIAGTADEIYLGAMGCMLRLKPGPVTLMDPGVFA